MKSFLMPIVFSILMLPGLGRGVEGGHAATIQGYVIDSACTFVKDLKNPVSPECARACAKAGSPLVILTNDGTIYWPISAQVPAQGQNARLMPFAGRRATVTGTVYRKGGSCAIVISKIHKADRQ